MSSDTRVSVVGRLPDGDANGLAAIGAELEKDPSRKRFGVIVFDVEEIQDKVRAGKNVVRIKVLRIENIRDAEDGRAMQRLLQREFERRTGQTMLPLDLEADVEAAFADLDTDTVAVQERERAEAAQPHEGASDEWADTLRAMRLGEQPAQCGVCQADIRWDNSHEGWLDGQGFPAADGHRHEPANQAATETGTTESEQE